MGKKLKRVLTGVQSTGVPHLGNILGAIIPAINFSKKDYAKRHHSGYLGEKAKK